MHNGDVKPRSFERHDSERPSREILHEYTIMSCFAVRMKLNGLQNALDIEGVSIYQMMW
jgi:hypothetical protein